MNKANGSARNIDEYIAGFPGEVQKMLQQLRTTIQKAAPEAEEAIKYQIPTFFLHGNLVHFAAYKNHIGFYPTPSGIEAFKVELSRYQSARGSVQFPIDRPLPLGLIENIVKFRVEEARAKSMGKTKKRKKSTARFRSYSGLSHLETGFNGRRYTLPLNRSAIYRYYRSYQ